MAMDASPLSKLPPELRNMVYHEVLRQEDPIILFFNQWDDLEEISEETRDLFFAVNSFTIEVTDLEARYPR
ncbi:hypothetical protein KC320_g89 [Hortaea werneckii]|nr:hypothetical protein KC320_g89 [Hortaea werneckii]